ncbi:hypothetical protein [Synechococcus sp. BIOS-E4-1]|uniref:hypothetical protein n=1 Tax=Synechococcus sp. BIOS-E4-1 TaxID=1400864 RepID=UPI00164662A4|nr:hypothetical protein [Synechococcus sp. BIOS-E4-1]
MGFAKYGKTASDNPHQRLKSRFAEERCEWGEPDKMWVWKFSDNESAAKCETELHKCCREIALNSWPEFNKLHPWRHGPKENGMYGDWWLPCMLLVRVVARGIKKHGGTRMRGPSDEQSLPEFSAITLETIYANILQIHERLNLLEQHLTAN